MIKEKEVLKRRVAELEQRPELLPCGLPERTRAAFDAVRKWDSDYLVDGQKKTIRRLQKEIEGLKQEVERLRTGNGVVMKDFWEQFSKLYSVQEHPSERALPTYNPSEHLHSFVHRLILEIQDEEDRDEGTFGFSMLLPRVLEEP